MDQDEQPLGSGYVLQRRIGRGAAGEVWVARNRESGEIVAAKVLHSDHVQNPEVQFRFLQEAERQRRLEHPGIVRVREVVVERSVLALVMDYVPGANLREHLAIVSTLAPADGCRIIAEVAAAVAAAHSAGVVHRDIKPENIMLPEQGGSAKIVDFGVARALHAATVTRGSVIPGTPAYLAPEVQAGRPAERACDVYALGLVLAEVLVGRRPTDLERKHLATKRGTSLGPFAALPEPVRHLLGDCLADKPGKRPAAHQLSGALSGLAQAVQGVPRLPAAPAEDIEAILADSEASSTAGGRRRSRGAWGTGAVTRLGLYRTWLGTAALVLVVLSGVLLLPDLPARSHAAGGEKTTNSLGQAGGEELPGGAAPKESTSPVSSATTSAAPPPNASAPPRDGTVPVPAPGGGTGSAPAQPPSPRVAPPPAVVVPPVPVRSTAPAAPPPAAPRPEPTQITTPEKQCGPGFSVSESKRLTRAVVYLLWNGTYQQNCVITLKTKDIGTATPTSVYLRVVGGSSDSDSGNFEYFAGAVRLTAPSCIYWGGSDGITSFDSPKGHC